MNSDSNVIETPEEVECARDRANGHAHGVAWVQSGRATRKQLKWLEGARERYDVTFNWADLVALHNNGFNQGTGVGLYQDIVRVKDPDMGRCELYDAAKDFWAAALGDDDAIDWMGDDDFALGFLEGAMEAWTLA